MLFSIITVSLNAENLIAETINSVLSQDFDDYEIIIKDGCSTDNTVKMVPQSDKIRVIVENDTGIYNAMNQGIREAKGEYLLFLNCGDTLYSKDVLSEVAKVIEEQNGEECIVYGNIYQTIHGEYKYPSKIKKRRFYFTSIGHPTSYFARGIFDKVGLYDESMRIAADRAFFLDCAIKKIKFVYIDKILSLYLNGGVSDTEYGIRVGEEEMKKVKKTRYNIFERIFLNFVGSSLGQFLVRLKNKILKRESN